MDPPGAVGLFAGGALIAGVPAGVDGRLPAWTGSASLLGRPAAFTLGPLDAPGALATPPDPCAPPPLAGVLCAPHQPHPPTSLFSVADAPAATAAADCKLDASCTHVPDALRVMPLKADVGNVSAGGGTQGASRYIRFTNSSVLAAAAS